MQSKYQTHHWIRIKLTSSSESLEVDASAEFSTARPNFPAEGTDTEDQPGCWEEVEEPLPTIRASNFAIFVGREWSDWFEELDEKWMSMSSDIVAVTAHC